MAPAGLSHLAPALRVLHQPAKLRGHAFHVALLAIGPIEKRTPAPPLGVLGLDPATLVVAPPLFIPAPGGKVSFELVVPNVTALAGAPFYAQALVVDQWLAAPRLTNVVADRIWKL